MFIDEEQWSRAYDAAKNEVEALYARGLIDVPTGHVVNGTLHTAAVQIATAALRAAAQDDEGDVSSLPGVRVAQIRNSTTTYQYSVGAPPVDEDEMPDDHSELY